MLAVTLGFKNFQSEQVKVHYSFLEPVNLELRLAVFNFLPIFSLICSWFFKNFESIAAKFRSHNRSTISFSMLCQLNWRLFSCFCIIVKLQRRKSKLLSSWTTNCQKIFSIAPHRAKALYNLGIVAILLANTRKLLKFYRFESTQDFVFFIDLNFFFCLFLVYFAIETGIVFNFLNFEQKWASCLLKKCCYKKSVLLFLLTGATWHFFISLNSRWFSM